MTIKRSIQKLAAHRIVLPDWPSFQKQYSPKNFTHSTRLTACRHLTKHVSATTKKPFFEELAALTALKNPSVGLINFVEVKSHISNGYRLLYNTLGS